MTIQVKYERVTMWRDSVYTEDTRRNASRKDLSKAWQFLAQHHDAAVHVYDIESQFDDMAFFWDSLAEFDEQRITVRYYSGRSYVDVKESFKDAKREVLVYYNII